MTHPRKKPDDCDELSKNNLSGKKTLKRKNIEVDDSEVQPQKKMCSWSPILGTIDTKKNQFVLLLRDFCFNDEGYLCVLVRNTILLFDDDFVEQGEIKVENFNPPLNGSGIRLYFIEDTFYITDTQQNKVYMIKEGLTTFISAACPKAVCYHDGLLYILGKTYLEVVKEQKLGSERIPMVLFEEKGSMVTFSDFIIVDNIAFILDSFAGDIYKYDLLTRAKTATKVYFRGNPRSVNPQCIYSCEKNKQILISETDNHKISSFLLESGDHFRFIEEYPLTDENYIFKPHKIIAKSKKIFVHVENTIY